MCADLLLAAYPCDVAPILAQIEKKIILRASNTTIYSWSVLNLIW